ncbi:unnamed protein product [Brachionus calyciflorus]|uniref:Flavin-containing monooxygenase n=1 Tax=Brachionus calyciflorus TaxID=104777 RepID=A0A813PXT8_9BILA|nr:unnamed protein product [Brachionus calyciflorus]
MGEKVAIIGAGAIGLCCAKRALEKNLEPVIFDKEDHPCGLWIPGRKVWEKMRVNGSNFLLAFIDYPWPDDSPVFPRSEEVYQYLISYINTYSLSKYIKLNTQVQKITKLADNQWEITTKNLIKNETKTEIFKYLIISTGLNNKPYIPDIKGLEKFMGKIMHSSEYRNDDEIYRDKRVLVVGNSSSAVEIASDLVNKAKSVTNIFTRPYLIFKKIIKIQNENESLCNLIPVDFLFFNRDFLHKIKNDRESLKKIIFDHCSSQLGYTLNPNLKNLKFDLENEYPRFAVSDDYIDFVKSGKINVKKARIDEFDEELIYFNDESFTQKDIVIFATGFSLGLENFFDENILEMLKYQENFEKDQIILYENTWHPDLPNCAFLGLARGLYFTGAELQAIYASRVFSGEIKLPNREVMLNEIKKAEENRIKNEHLKLQYPYGSYVGIVDNLAKKLDMLPNFDKLKMVDSDVFRMMWLNPIIPCHFLIKENYDKALQLMKKVDRIAKRKFNSDEAYKITPENYPNA